MNKKKEDIIEIFYLFINKDQYETWHTSFIASDKLLNSCFLSFSDTLKSIIYKKKKQLKMFSYHNLNFRNN